MGMSRSGYFRSIKTANTIKIDPDFHLISRVRQIHKQSRRKYGSRRMSRQLRAEGYDAGRYRARNLMKKAGVSFSYKKKFKRTTDSNHNFPVARNLLNRKFDVEKPNTVWCSDISYLWTNEGWMYLAVVIDLFSRRVVGWSTSSRMKASIVCDALRMAIWQRKPAPGLIVHSDRGAQYASNAYRLLLNTHQCIGSMSRKGNCWDNAVAESFFGSLKQERVQWRHYQTRLEAQLDILDYITMFYNHHRLHSYLEYRSPKQFEAEMLELKKLA